MHLGVDVGGSSPNLRETLIAALQSGAGFAVVPLFHPRYRRDHQKSRSEPATRSDLLLNSEQWSEQVVGKLSPWLQLDSPHAHIRRRSEEAFKQEIAWATHLSITNLLLDAPTASSVNYARFVQWACLSAPHMHLLVRVPICSPPAQETGLPTTDAAPPLDPADTPWAAWNQLRLMCESAPSVGVALELTADLPEGDEEIERWCGEPLSAVIVPTSIFQTNKKGYPALSRRHQVVLQKLLAHRPKLIVVGRPDEHQDGIAAYVNYLRFLENKIARDTELQSLERPYYDYLQAPLQPLQDNLESQTYETFERDPVKYKQYQEAVRRGLVDRHPADGPEPTLMVVGAGRGPLVAAALAAAKECGRRVHVYALDKNENAVRLARRTTSMANLCAPTPQSTRLALFAAGDHATESLPQ